MLTPAVPAGADVIRDRQWHLSFLRIAEAQRYSEGNGVVVGLVDTGVDANHPDLAGALGVGTDLAGGDGRQDIDGHGTTMAGLIAARGRPGGNGALGVAPRSKVLPIQAGVGYNVADRGIDWAVEHGAKVISLSFGKDSDDSRLEAAVARAVAADVVVVAGVGNTSIIQRVGAPARFPGVVAVAGVDRSGNHAAVSVVGPEVVLAAPAVGIVSTDLNGGYGEGDGTSDATAIVSGVVALVRAKFPDLKASEVVHRLTATAIDKGPPGRDEQYGFGIVNPVAALTADVPTLPATATATAAPATSASAGTAAPNGTSNTRVLIWVIGGVLLAAAAVGAVIATRRRS